MHLFISYEHTIKQNKSPKFVITALLEVMETRNIGILRCNHICINVTTETK